MKDDPNNIENLEPNLEPWIEPELEARIVALVLGEASDFEQGELERLIAEQPELALFRDRMEATHGLLWEVARGEDDAAEWKLSTTRRDSILELISAPAKQPEAVVAPRSAVRRPWVRWVSYAAAACIVGMLLLGILMPVGHQVNKRVATLADAEAPISESMVADGSESLFGLSNHAQIGNGSNFNSPAEAKTTAPTVASVSAPVPNTSSFDLYSETAESGKAKSALAAISDSFGNSLPTDFKTTVDEVPGSYNWHSDGYADTDGDISDLAKLYNGEGESNKTRSLIRRYAEQDVEFSPLFGRDGRSDHDELGSDTQVASSGETKTEPETSMRWSIQPADRERDQRRNVEGFLFEDAESPNSHAATNFTGTAELHRPGPVMTPPPVFDQGESHQLGRYGGYFFDSPNNLEGENNSDRSIAGTHLNYQREKLGAEGEKSAMTGSGRAEPQKLALLPKEAKPESKPVPSAPTTPAPATGLTSVLPPKRPAMVQMQQNQGLKEGKKRSAPIVIAGKSAAKELSYGIPNLTPAEPEPESPTFERRFRGGANNLRGFDFRKVQEAEPEITALDGDVTVEAAGSIITGGTVLTPKGGDAATFGYAGGGLGRDGWADGSISGGAISIGGGFQGQKAARTNGPMPPAQIPQNLSRLSELSDERKPSSGAVRQLQSDGTITNGRSSGTLIGRAKIAGNVHTKDKVLRNELAITPDQSINGVVPSWEKTSGKKLPALKQLGDRLQTLQQSTGTVDVGGVAGGGNIVIDVSEEAFIAGEIAARGKDQNGIVNMDAQGEAIILGQVMAVGSGGDGGSISVPSDGLMIEAEVAEVEELSALRSGDQPASPMPIDGQIAGNKKQVVERSPGIRKLAETIENTGYIGAVGGNVAMASGGEVMMSESKDGNVVVSRGVGTGHILNSESGTIENAKAAQASKSGNPLGMVIQNRGSIRASGQVTNGGTVVLTQPSPPKPKPRAPQPAPVDDLAAMVPDEAQASVSRRLGVVAKADEASLRAERLMADKDYDGAVVELKKSLDLLPDAPVTEGRRKEAAERFGEAAIQLAKQKAEEGRYDEAIELTSSVLDPAVDPTNDEARRLLEDLNDTDFRTRSPAITPEFISKVKKVEQALKVAESHIRLGDYEGAQQKYNEVLKNDRYNSSARRGLEDVERNRQSYFKSAYDQTRSKFDTEIDTFFKSPTQPVNFPEESATEKPFSTFSLNVSDVSFKLAQDALAKGSWPERERIRVEEFVNAFDYGDPMPSQREKVACRQEQVIHPFLQQRNLLRIAMRTAAAGRGGQTPLRLTILLDKSGSMERPDRVATVERALVRLVEQLLPNDQVTLLSFARQTRLLADQAKGDDLRKLAQLTANTPTEGGTNLEAALRLAFEKAQEQKQAGAQNRIVLITDGAANLGDANPERLSGMIENMRDRGIAFDAAGIGAEGLNDGILEALTRKGDGRYYLLNQPKDADDGFAKQIAGALRPSAKNVKIQVEFNPKRVGRYKLIGFEKHRLKKEDFRNDKVDAAEMAAEEAGVALYQVEPLADGQGDIGSVSVRFRDMASGQMIERRWPIPYEPSACRLGKANRSLKLATCAAMLGAKLKGDALGQSVDLDQLSRYAAGLTGERPGQLRQMIQQARDLTNE